MCQTVAAISTPPGQGGISVIRLSGNTVYNIVEKLFVPANKNKKIKNAIGYTAMFGHFYFKEKILDEGIALFFRAPHSYTGEDLIELSCHGGETVTRQLLQSCFTAGAHPAPAGEFTKRAVLNGRLSLTQAEAVMDIISASSRQGVALAEAALGGAFNKIIEEQKQRLLSLAAHLAAYIDFPEEGVESLSEKEFLKIAQQVQVVLQGLIKNYDKGVVLRRGISAAIIGSPNVGKSTIFNLLSGQERAIVTAVAGTTRDVVREQIQLDGVLLNIADTAGLHLTKDVVEAEGIRRSYSELEQASLVIAVFDGSEEFSAMQKEFAEKMQGKPSLAIINKSDLVKKIVGEELDTYFTKVVSISAHQQQSREIIEQAILQVLKLDSLDTNSASIANERQLVAVVSARDALNSACETINFGITLDAAGVYLEDAISAFAQLSGDDVPETVLDEVFSTFCVGK